MLHTPGPWSINDQNPDDEEIEAPSGPVAIALGREAEANARLIAAAPDLLAALEECLLNSDIHGKYGPPARSLEKARAAIAKAKGGA